MNDWSQVNVDSPDNIIRRLTWFLQSDGQAVIVCATLGFYRHLIRGVPCTRHKDMWSRNLLYCIQRRHA